MASRNQQAKMAGPTLPAIWGSPQDYERLRRDLGVDCDVLSDVDAEILLAEAAERYPFSAAKRNAYARVLAILSFLPGGARMGKYVQNQSTEDLSMVFGNLREWLKIWQDEVQRAQDVPTTPPTNPGAAIFALASGRRGASWG